MHLKIQVFYGNLDVQLLKDGATYSAGEIVYYLYTEATISVYGAQEKGHLELLNLLLEKGAPENPGFLWQFRRSVIKRWSNLLCR